MATTTAPPSFGRSDHQELRRFLNALRLQLWWRDVLVLLAGASLISALLFAFIGAIWPAGVCALLLVVAAVARRPSVVRAARVADRQLHTESRLATAAEVLDGRLGGALASSQLDDAWRRASGVSVWHAFPRTWRRVQLAAVAIAASLAVVALTLVGVVTPMDVPAVLGLDTSTANTPDSAAAPADDANSLADAAARPEAKNMDDLQAQAARSQATQAALQRLADALRSTAAAGDVGDALRAGNYDDAIAKLNTLATQSDQLSRNAKRDLGAALERSAIDSAKLDPPLAVAEDRVARALSRNVYSDTRSAMQDLAKQVGDARNGVVSQEELARELSQLEQSQTQKTTPGGGGGDIGESEVGYIPDIPGEAPNQVGLVQGVSSTISVPGPEGDPNTSKRSSVGQEAGGDPFGDLTSRLDVAANDVSVDAQVAGDQGRSGLKANPVAPVVKISDATQTNVTPSDVAPSTEPVQAAGEQSVEPSAQRSAVRSFFKPDTSAPGP